MPIMAENKEEPAAQTPALTQEQTTLSMAHSFFVTKISIISLASIMVSVVGVLLISIFEILGPAFQTVVGCFVGMVSANFIRK
jgi:hypothetical protein